jgi:hypothetical protein
MAEPAVSGKRLDCTKFKRAYYRMPVGWRLEFDLIGRDGNIEKNAFQATGCSMIDPGLRPDPESVVRCDVIGAFTDWLRDSGGALAITTYQAGKVALVSWDRDAGRLRLLLREFAKPMGLTGSGGRMALATRDTVFQLANAPFVGAGLSGRPRPALRCTLDAAGRSFHRRSERPRSGLRA